MSQTKFDDEEVTTIDNSPFGRALFNLYSLERAKGTEHLFFSDRLTVVRQMIRTMLDAEAEIKRRRPVPVQASSPCFFCSRPTDRQLSGLASAFPNEEPKAYSISVCPDCWSASERTPAKLHALRNEVRRQVS